MKTAVITGGSQGLGKEMAKKLVKQEYQVILLARREEILKQAVDEIGGNTIYYVCDIKDRKQIAQVVEVIKDQYGHIDLLVNNAGVWTDENLQKDHPEKQVDAIETNLLGQIFITEAFLDLLIQDKVARIFCVISTAGVPGIPAGDNKLWKTYGASKWGIKGYIDALREQLRETNIQVLQFFPGGFDSNLYENAHLDNPHNQAWMMKTEDVAEIAVFAITRPQDVYMEQVVVSKFMK